MMCKAIFFVSANGKRIIYFTEASSVAVAGNTLGAFVGIGSAFNKCPAPGRKKSAGETLWLVLMPLQPVPNPAHTANIASGNKLRLNLTCHQYKSVRHDGNF